MSTSALTERAFEDAIIDGLVDQGWLHDGSTSSTAAGWDKKLALFVPDVLHWLQTQYPEEFTKAVPDAVTGTAREVLITKLMTRLADTLAKPPLLNARTKDVQRGLLGVLRGGFAHAQPGKQKATFGPLVAFHPENPLYTAATQAANSNRLRVLRQVPFDSGTNHTLDLVLTVNGIPVVTMELKTDNTQAVQDAINQYKRDREPSKQRPLLAPGRALVHFAVSNQDIYMTTELAGKATTFLPFNQGNDGHAGNPPNPHGSATAYLWQQVLTPELFLRILRDYALWEPSSKGNKGRLIFPRYHQLRATEKVVADINARSAAGGAGTHGASTRAGTRSGAGGRYLIQHSAGSGKTKTIAWMAHRTGRIIGADGRPVFDSVIVVTDRTVLDDNVKEGIDLLRASEGLVVNIDNEMGSKSKKLEAALNRGNHIITCTIQTFPALAKMMETSPHLQGRNYCVIVDEAHSSQHGEAAKRLREILVDVDTGSGNTDDLSADEMLLAVDSAVANSANLSFIALTATPKAKTLAAYGTDAAELDPETEHPGRKVAFDSYHMSQAIEEGFILDVLTNYSTYEMFARIRDEMGRNDKVDLADAVTDMVRFVRMHPTSIAQKVEITVEHFRRNVMHHLGGTAKAMVVTANRAAAMTWSLKMNEYITARGYTDMTTLVAFSGNLEHHINGEPVTYTEASVNKVGDVATHFRNHDEAKVLIVANKFQTGFDEPRLTAMYVDRSLGGVQAVQTLSRLNRIFPGKPHPMVVDFVNTPEQILAAFQPYYRDAKIDDEVPANALDDLGEELDATGFYDENDIENVAEVYLTHNSSGAQRAEALQAAGYPVVKAWNDHMKSAHGRRDESAREQGLAFLANVRKYAHAWEFLSQIVDFQDVLLHKRAILANWLASNLNPERTESMDDYTEGIELVGVAVEPITIEEDLELAATEVPEALDLPGFSGQPLSPLSPVHAAFDEAVDKVNELLTSLGMTGSTVAASSAIRASYGILVEDETVRDLVSENDASQIAGAETFRIRGLNSVITAAKESNEVFDTITTDTENLNVFLEAMAHMLVAARNDTASGNTAPDKTTQ